MTEMIMGDEISSNMRSIWLLISVIITRVFQSNYCFLSVSISLKIWQVRMEMVQTHDGGNGTVRPQTIEKAQVN